MTWQEYSQEHTRQTMPFQKPVGSFGHLQVQPAQTVAKESVLLGPPRNLPTGISPRSKTHDFEVGKRTGNHELQKVDRFLTK